MCLTTKKTEQEKIEWLKKQPDIITAYKVVKKRTGKLKPLYSATEKGFKRKNHLFPVVLKYFSEKWQTDMKYIAYFHLFINEDDAVLYNQRPLCAKVIKCTVPKKYITDVGYQWGRVIVTRQFSIVGEDEYLN